MICHCLRYIFVPFRFFAIRHWCSTSPWLADDIGLTTVRLIISKKLPYRRADFSSFIYNFLARCGTHFLLMKRDPADQHETTIWRNQTDTVTWLAVSVSLPTLLGYQRASAFVNATKLASQPLFFFRRRIQNIERFIEHICYWYRSRVYRDTYRYRFIAQP